jgi:hypothetical protein
VRGLWLTTFFLFPFLFCVTAQAQSDFDFRTTPGAPNSFDLRNAEDCEARSFVTCEQECDSESAGLAAFRCQRDCLGRKCPAPESIDFAVSNDPTQCILQSSEPCVKNCVSHTGASAARCRRDCLTKRCAASEVFDIAKEAERPGYMSCVVCRKESEQFCRQICMATGGGSGGLGSGRASLGCNVSCLRFRCARECGFSLTPGTTGDE